MTEKLNYANSLENMNWIKTISALSGYIRKDDDDDFVESGGEL